MGCSVALLLLPLTLDVALAGRRALEVFGLSRGPWSTPSFAQLLRGADGTFGSSWLGWLLPAAALLGLILCRGERRALASKVTTIATLTLVLATLDARHWMGSFAPDLDVLLALYVLMIALLIGLGVSALELDLRHAGFGWRQIMAGFVVAALAVATLPFLASFETGRFDLPTTSVAESLSTLAPTSAGSYRVLWLGDPTVMPLAGWPVAPGLEAATSMNGLPGGATLFSPPDSGTSDVLLSAVQLALQGRTVRLGQLLATAGISTIVVMNSSAPELAGVQLVPFRPVPMNLVTALGRQSDLSLVLETNSVAVFANSLFHGLVAQSTSATTSTWTALTNPTFASAPLTSGAMVVAGLAPASAFTLNVTEQVGTTITTRAVARHTFDGWAPAYQLASSNGALSGQLVLHRLPFNGVLAAGTLVLWVLAGLGFGWVRRLEWLFKRRRGVSAGRHVRRDANE